MNKKRLSLILAYCLLFTSLATSVYAEDQTTTSVNASITVTDAQLQSAKPLTQFKNMGVNFEMSKTSDEMWNSNGKWMEQTYAGSGIKIIRWGYDAWVYDWENELPLNTNYQGGMNTKDSAGSFGLREFLHFAKSHDIIPFLHIPIESWNHKNGKSDPTYARVLQLAENMATYLNNNGFDQVYFDMGNEPMEAPSNPYGTFSAATYGSTFKDFYTRIKSINPNYKIVMLANNMTWYNNVKATASEGGVLYFDAIDYHNYPNNNVGWDLYYNRNDDNIFGSFGTIDPGIEKILGEANIPWPNFPTYSTSLGSGLALLNGFLKLAQNDEYSSVIMWPSQWPSNSTAYNSFNPSGKSFGWFDQDAWYDSKTTKRLNGPMLAEMIAQKNVLSHQVGVSSSDPKLRTFSFTNEDKSQLNMIVINKRKEDVTLSLNVPNRYNAVKASVFKGAKDANGTANADLNPDYAGHLVGEELQNSSYMDYLNYGESAIIYTFYIDNAIGAPSSFNTLLPSANASDISTAHNFTWSQASGSSNYRIVISEHADLSNPVVDTTTLGFQNYQPTNDLKFSTRYYWKVVALNVFGGTDASGGIQTFETARQRHFVDDHDASIQYTGNWSHQNYLGAFGRKDHGTASPNATATITFNGTEAIVYGIKDDWIRKISVSINNGPEQVVDLYRSRGIMTYRADDPARYSRGSGETDTQKIARLNGTAATQDVLFSTGKLSDTNQQHTVKITVLNEYNPAITKSWKGLELDYYEIIKAGETPVQTSAKPATLITDLPASKTATTGQSVQLSVSAASPDQGIVTYEWYRDGKLLTHTGNSLIIPNASSADAGQYMVRITNMVNDAMTNTIQSTVCNLLITDS